MKARPAPRPSDRHRHLLVALVACPVVFAVTFLYALLSSYPSWMWWAVMGGLLLPIPVAVVVIAMLVGESRARHAAG